MPPQALDAGVTIAIHRPSPDDFTLAVPQVTRWRDEDKLGHINNSMYFTYEESARMEYLNRVLGPTTGFTGGAVILAHVECDFVTQLHHPSNFTSYYRVESIGRSSAKTEGAIFVGDELMAVTRSVLVWFDYATNVTIPVPAVSREAIRSFERKAPEERTA
ncbi:MAG: acyl-CoA thioesterase [Microbacteriaceae bacterium]|nr:acyl-CoA thioesterase [Microbacteriaceae bacterium]